MKLEQAGKRGAFARLSLLVFCASVLHAGAQESGRFHLQHPRFENADANSPVSHVSVEAISSGAEDRVVKMHLITVHWERCRLAVIDNPRGDEMLAEAMQRTGALAGVNGGYFKADRTPVGLEISGGKLIHPFERAKLLSGVLAVSSGRVALLRAGEFSTRRKQEKPDDALQAGPFLVHEYKAVPGLNTTRRARRTAVLMDDRGQLRLLVTEAVTLAELAQILCAGEAPIGNNTVKRALNLDGGSSTGLWLKAEPEPFYLREGKDVRNYLAVIPR